MKIKRLKYLLIAGIVSINIFVSCKKKETQTENQIETDSFTDQRDGTVYKCVKIGTQTWMAEDLKYTGNDIQHITAANDWINNTHYNAWCYYDNDVNYGNTYGVLYQWQAAINACPDGWHLPTKTEWETLIDYLGGASVSGGKLKEAGTNHWNSPNTDATNETGFTALPSGYRLYSTGDFFHLGNIANYWSVTETNNSNQAFGYSLDKDNGEITLVGANKLFGFSVRCIKN